MLQGYGKAHRFRGNLKHQHANGQVPEQLTDLEKTGNLLGEYHLDEYDNGC